MFSVTVLLVFSSSVKLPHSPVVSKIDNRLEQYTSAAQVRPRAGVSSSIWIQCYYFCCTILTIQ